MDNFLSSSHFVSFRKLDFVYNNRMRIGFFTEGYLPKLDGVATSVIETAKELERRGHEVFIVAPKYPGYVDRNKNVFRVPSIRVHPEYRIGVNIPNKAVRKVFSTDFDIIHAHSGGPITLLGREIAREKRIPFVFTNHTLWNRYTHYFMNGKVIKPKAMEQLSKLFGNIADCVVAPTQRVEKELRHYGVKKPITIIPSGLPVQKFKKAPFGFLRSKIKNEKDPIVLFVGRLAKEKSPDFLIRSFRIVAETIPGVQLVLIGEGVDRKKLESLVKKLSISERCHFVGNVPANQMYKAYRDASVFAFPSTTETQGLVVQEALSSGVPVVVVNDPAYESIKNGRNGFLVEKKETLFAEKIIDILKDNGLHKRLSEEAVSTSDSFSIETAVDKLESVYFDLLDKRNVESVPRIMAENERAEKIYTAGVVFWTVIVLSRILNLLFYKSSAFPALQIGGQTVTSFEIGLILILIFLAAFLHKRSVGFWALVALGAGTAFVANEVFAIIFGAQNISAYWSYWNLIPIIAVGIVAGFFSRTSSSDRPKFYINTKIQKHINPKNPKISVVIPAYNEGEFIVPTLKSLINQTYKNFEIIVVDNNSSDSTGEVAASYGARVVKEATKGVAAARAKGFSEAKGEIITSTDADSVVPSDWLAKIAAAYQDSKLAGFAGLNVLYSGAVSARAAGRYLFPLFWKIDKKLSGGWNMAGFNMSVRKSSYEKSGGFDPGLKMGEDIDLSKKLRTVGEIKIDDNLIVYSSGRRYSRGLLAGLKSYAPQWIDRVILKKDKEFEFSDVRDEGKDTSRYSFVPISIVILALILIFYSANLKLLSI